MIRLAIVLLAIPLACSMAFEVFVAGKLLMGDPAMTELVRMSR